MHGPVRVAMSGLEYDSELTCANAKTRTYKKISIVKNAFSSLFTEIYTSQKYIGTRLFGTALIKGSYVTGKSK